MSDPILIVEDNDDDYEATARALKKNPNFNNPIYRCEDGQATLDYLLNVGEYTDKTAAPRPAIILLDLNMPGKDGRMILSEIKQNPQLQLIPVVILTTSDDQKDVQSCYQAGANSFLKKPISLEDYTVALKNLIDYWFGAVILPKQQ